MLFWLAIALGIVAVIFIFITVVFFWIISQIDG